MKEFYANDSNNARPVQDKRIVTKYSKENIKFYDHTPEDSEKCARFKTEYGAGDMADITMNDTFSGIFLLMFSYKIHKIRLESILKYCSHRAILGVPLRPMCQIWIWVTNSKLT